MIARWIAVTAMLAVALLTQAHAQGASPAPLPLTEPQAQAPESLRRSSDLAVDQSRATLAESRRMFERGDDQNKLTLDRTNQMALQAIQVAKDSNEYTKT